MNIEMLSGKTETRWHGRIFTPTGTLAHTWIFEHYRVYMTCPTYSRYTRISEPPIAVFIGTLETGYNLVKPIIVTARQVDNAFVASFSEANINASGDTVDDAVLNLRCLIADLFDLLREHTLDTLGQESARQLSVLRSYITK